MRTDDGVMIDTLLQALGGSCISSAWLQCICFGDGALSGWELGSCGHGHVLWGGGEVVQQYPESSAINLTNSMEVLLQRLEVQGIERGSDEKGFWRTAQRQKPFQR